MRIGSIEPIVDLFADEVDTEGDDGDAKARGGVAELIGEHRMLPPCIPSPEELSSVFSTSRSHSILPSLLTHSLCFAFLSFLPPLLGSRDPAQITTLFKAHFFLLLSSG